MKHPFYSVSIDDIPFGDRIIAILLRTYLVRFEDAKQKLAAVLSEGIVLKLPALAKDQDAIPLRKNADVSLRNVMILYLTT